MKKESRVVVRFRFVDEDEVGVWNRGQHRNARGRQIRIDGAMVWLRG